MNYVFLCNYYCDFMTRKREKPKFGRRPKRTSDGVEIPQACFKCLWKKAKTAVAKVKCTNKDAEVLQKDNVWLCYSCIDHTLNNKKKEKGGEKSEGKS